MPVQAVRRSAPSDDPRRLVGLHIRDLSHGGIGALSAEPLRQAEPVLLFFPPMGAGRGRDVEGQVVRCLRRDDRFDVGIAFDQPWADREDWAPWSVQPSPRPTAEL